MQAIRRLLIFDYLSSKLTNYVSLDLNAYLDSIKAGFPCEIIGGDHFYLRHRFLTKTFGSFNENEQQRILVIRILDPSIITIYVWN
jgi:hypothetical protein